MNPVSELFDQFSRGILDDAGIDILNRQLVEIYFSSPGELTFEELEYAEDLVIELFIKNGLEEKYLPAFSKRINEDTDLFSKFKEQRDLTNAALSRQDDRLNQVTGMEVPDKSEEELRAIIAEAIKKAEAEKEKTSVNAWLKNLLVNFRKQVEAFLSRINPSSVQARLAMAIASFALIIGFAWLVLKPGGNELPILSDNKTPEKGKQEVINPENPEISDSLSLDQKTKEMIMNLIVSRCQPEKSFPLYQGKLRNAAAKYNEKDYDSCRHLLSNLLENNTVNNKDTISILYYYLGNCCIALGLTRKDYSLLGISLDYMSMVKFGNPHYLAAQYYMAIAYATQGYPYKSIRIMDSLIQLRFDREGNVKVLRDSLALVIRKK
jgi:hypothetical protein